MTSYLIFCVCIEILLEEGVDTDVVNSLGYTPLMQACRTGNKEITAMLLERHANPEQVAIRGTLLQSISRKVLR